MDRITLPSKNTLIEFTKTLRPPILDFREGAKVLISEAISYTLVEQLLLISGSGKLDIQSIRYSYSYGYDGSGDMSDYHHRDKKKSTKNVMSGCLTLNSIEDQEGNVLWSDGTLGHNSVRLVRPIFLFPDKESDAVLQEIVPDLEKEIETLRTNPLKLELPDGQVIAANVGKVDHYLDGKMLVRLMQLGGAFCTMCCKSQMECHDPLIVSAGFEIDRYISDIRDLSLTLQDPETEEIQKSPGDYSLRKGITGVPITSSELTRVIPVCHAKIHCIDYIINRLLIRQNTHQKWHAPYKPVRFSEDERERIKVRIQDHFGINIGESKDMLTGNVFQVIASDEFIEFLGDEVKDETKRAPFETFHLNLAAIVRVVNSQHEKVDIASFRNLCTKTNLILCEHFPWAQLSVSMHRILAHSYEIIDSNDQFGLGNQSEEGLESQNKYIRFLREHASRKTSTSDNFKDTFIHLWNRSSPLLVSLDREKKNSKQNCT